MYIYIYTCVFSALILGHWSLVIFGHHFPSKRAQSKQPAIKNSLSVSNRVIPVIRHHPWKCNKQGRSGPMFYTRLGQR